VGPPLLAIALSQRLCYNSFLIEQVRPAALILSHGTTGICLLVGDPIPSCFIGDRGGVGTDVTELQRPGTGV
jgi:hypothetical protein